MRYPAKADAGFTLLEVLVAFVIGAFSLYALFGLTSSSLRSTGSMDQRLISAIMAQSVLAEFGASRALDEGETDESGDYDARIQTWTSLIAAGESYQLYEITVRVSQATGSSYELVTRRAGPAGQP